MENFKTNLIGLERNTRILNVYGRLVWFILDKRGMGSLILVGKLVKFRVCKVRIIRLVW